MYHQKIEVIKIIASPDELREIADKVERKHQTARIGDDTLAHVEHYNGVVLEFRIGYEDTVRLVLNDSTSDKTM